MKVVKRDPNMEMKLAFYDCISKLKTTAGGIDGMLNCLDRWINEAEKKYFSLGGSIEEAQELYQHSVDKSNGRNPGLKIVNGDFSDHPAGSAPAPKRATGKIKKGGSDLMK
jgi:hypothetical protein